MGIFLLKFLNDLFEFGNGFVELDVFDEHLLIFGLAQFHMLDFVLLGLDYLLLFLYLSFQLIYLLLLGLQMQILLRLEFFQQLQPVLHCQIHRVDRAQGVDIAGYKIGEKGLNEGFVSGQRLRAELLVGLNVCRNL